MRRSSPRSVASVAATGVWRCHGARSPRSSTASSGAARCSHTIRTPTGWQSPGSYAATGRRPHRARVQARHRLRRRRASCYSGARMEFGLFVQAHVPEHEVDADPEGAEPTRLLRELELAEACDRSGWKYVWSVEHHFLQEYSHISASEIFLPYVAARTKQIHVGSAIYNITPPVNHPARIAERVAMMDPASEGRLRVGHARGGL